MSRDWIDYDFSKYLQVMKHGGKQIAAKCPFHNDNVPSFSGNTETGLWKCWGCGEKGNWWQLLNKIGVSYKSNNK